MYIPLSVILLSFSHGLIIDAKYEDAKKIINLCNPNKHTKNQYYYLKSIISYAENKKKETQNNLNDFEFSTNSNTPERWKRLIERISEDVATWKDGDLFDINRDMKKSAYHLDSGNGGEKTQKVQKDIIDKLDKMIEDMENKKANEMAQNQEKTDTPANESIPSMDSGKGIVTERKLKKYAEEWGKLPHSERIKAIQEITNDVPPKFKPMIEEYFRSLNKK